MADTLKASDLETTDLLARVSERRRAEGLGDVSKNVLHRLRAQYAEVRPARRVGHGLLLWPETLVEGICAILRREGR